MFVCAEAGSKWVGRVVWPWGRAIVFSGGLGGLGYVFEKGGGRFHFWGGWLFDCRLCLELGCCWVLMDG